jgi:hypothetical protein
MAKGKKTYDGLKNLIKKHGKEEPAADEKTSYRVTPKGILLFALNQVYGVDGSIDKLDRFMDVFLTGLSTLATGGADGDLFGKDFNGFFSSYVNMANMCGRMKAALDKYGITLDDEPGENEEDENDN